MNTSSRQIYRRPKVLIVLNAAWNLANFRMGLIEGLQQAGYEVVAAAPADGHEKKLKCRFVNLPMDSGGTHPLRDAALLLRFVRMLYAERPDVFLGYTIKPNVYGSIACRLLSIPVINNIAGLGATFVRTTWVTRVVRGLYRVALRKSVVVFFQNEDDQATFLTQRLVRAEQTARLPGSGVDLNQFSPRPFVAHEGGVIFLLVARLLWDKGVGEFVQAARLLRERGVRARFQLLGFLDVKNPSAVARADVDAWVADGIVEYLGSSDDVRPYIAAADCVALPSYREGVSRTLLEAAALGRPIIASNVPGCREVVDDAVTGFLCNARDAEDLARKMMQMIDVGGARRKEMGDRGRLKVEREFDEQLVVAQYLKAIKSIVA
jgi:glycosyltransferase involved in cell wall biosynthesis